jgi:MoaA/NifB/PqqE/SkfB family radical SAM enzyme
MSNLTTAHGGLPRPRKLVLEFSHNCNLHCIMCGFGGKPIVKEKFMSDEMVAKILSEEAFLAGIEEVRLNGRGESTIHPRFPAIIERVHEHFPRACYSIFTNMMFPSDAVLDTISAFDIEVYVSIDAADKARFETIRKGARFDVVDRRLDKVRRGFVVFTLQRENMLDLAAVGRFAAQHGLGFIVNVIHVDDATYVESFSRILGSRWGEIIAQFRQLHCLFPRKRVLIPDQVWGRPVPRDIATTTSCGSLPSCPNVAAEIMVGHDGTVFPCNMFHPAVLGELSRDRLETIWGSEARKAFLQTYRSHPYCINCEHMVPREA